MKPGSNPITGTGTPGDSIVLTDKDGQRKNYSLPKTDAYQKNTGILAILVIIIVSLTSLIFKRNRRQ